jgi:hypothetical protein
MSFEGVTNRTGMPPKVLGPVDQTSLGIVPHMLPQGIEGEFTAILERYGPLQRGAIRQR